MASLNSQNSILKGLKTSSWHGGGCDCFSALDFSRRGVLPIPNKGGVFGQGCDRFSALDFFSGTGRLPLIPNKNRKGVSGEIWSRERERAFRKYNVPGRTSAPLPSVFQKTINSAKKTIAPLGDLDGLYGTLYGIPVHHH